MAVYACGDLHGHLQIYEKICAMLKPGDKVFCVGDCGDRGPQSWETIKAVYNDPRFIYLKGNHEDMLVNACSDYLHDDYMWDYYSYSLCRSNGGESTMEAWERDPEREKWLVRLKNLPTWEVYENPSGDVFILSHAGLTPWLRHDVEDECIIPPDRMLLWDREHCFEDWNPAEMDDVIVVHGHTPIHHLADDIRETWLAGAFWYCNKHKICIDSGGFFSGEWVLLNLDTLEDIVLTLD